jgi:hypothetical protein
MRYFQINRTFLKIGCLRWLSKSTYFLYFLYFLRFLYYWRNTNSLLLTYYMRSLIGRPLLYLLSLLLLLFLRVSPSSLYLRLFFLLLHLNINIISSVPISNIMATGQKLIRVNGD